MKMTPTLNYRKPHPRRRSTLGTISILAGVVALGILGLGAVISSVGIDIYGAVIPFTLMIVFLASLVIGITFGSISVLSPDDRSDRGRLGLIITASILIFIVAVIIVRHI